MSTMSAQCRGVIAVVLSLALLAPSSHAGETPPAQQWVGEFRLDGQAVPLVLHDRSAAGDTPSAVDRPTMGARDVALARLDARDGHASFGPTCAGTRAGWGAAAWGCTAARVRCLARGRVVPR